MVEIGVFEIGILALLVALVAGRLLSERAARGLSPEERERLFAALGGPRLGTLLPPALLLGAYLLGLRALPAQQALLLLLFVVAVATYLLSLQALTIVRLRRAALPAAYLRTYLAGRALFYTGLVAFVVLLVLDGRLRT